MAGAADTGGWVLLGQVACPPAPGVAAGTSRPLLLPRGSRVAAALVSAQVAAGCRQGQGGRPVGPGPGRDRCSGFPVASCQPSSLLPEAVPAGGGFVRVQELIVQFGRESGGVTSTAAGVWGPLSVLMLSLGACTTWATAGPFPWAVRLWLRNKNRAPGSLIHPDLPSGGSGVPAHGRKHTSWFLRMGRVYTGWRWCSGGGGPCGYTAGPPASPAASWATSGR